VIETIISTRWIRRIHRAAMLISPLRCPRRIAMGGHRSGSVAATAGHRAGRAGAGAAPICVLSAMRDPRRAYSACVVALGRAAYRIASALRHGYWFVVRPQTSGVKCVIVHDGRWLMVRHTYGDRGWTFPGGGVHRGESVDAAVRREVREEVGIELDDVRLVGSYFSKRNHCRDTVSCFVADVATPAAAADGVEVAATAWVDPAQLPEPRTPAVDDVLGVLAAAEAPVVGRAEDRGVESPVFGNGDA
jgi:8-oxo-dGTP pyrophosphatase MutT (NUDIX family)